MRNAYIGIMLVVVSAFLVFYGLNMLIKGKASNSWPVCQGTVVSSDIEQESKTDSYEKQTVSYRAHVVYSYLVNGTAFRSNRIAFETYSTSQKGKVLAIANKYPAGETITVYYDPADPNSAILEKGTGTAAYFIIVVGCICVFLGTLYIFSARPGRTIEDEMIQTFRMGMEDPEDRKKMKQKRRGKL